MNMGITARFFVKQIRLAIRFTCKYRHNAVDPVLLL
jgi:hypothetical protein